MKGTYLGEFEEIVLLATGILQESAYGVSICKEIETQSGKVSQYRSSSYCTSSTRGKRFFEIQVWRSIGCKRREAQANFYLTAYGIKALREAQELRNNMWSQLPKIIIQKS